MKGVNVFMKKYLQDYVSDFEKELNIPLMNKAADRPLIEYIVDAWKSLEIIPNIKFLKYEYNSTESEVDINKFISKRDKKKRKKDRCDYKFIDDDRFGCLTVWLEITTVEKNRQTGNDTIHKKIIKKGMLVPVQDEDGYFWIKGKKYFIIYQLVDKSTYTSSKTVTLKSLMPVAVKRITIEKEDTTEKKHVLPIFNIFVFKKEIPNILFYASDGMSHALMYLGVDDIISFVDNVTDVDNEKFICFAISSKCYIKVRRSMFDKYQYVQAIVGMILNVSTNRLTLQDLDNPEIWIKKLSPTGSLEKGRDILIFFNRMLDETTKKILKLDNINKRDIYSLIRWMMMNFNELRMKDNLSLKNKRIRCNEYIASLLTMEFSIRLNRIITLGGKATMDDFKDLFKFSGDILLNKMHSSGILRFDDTINDQDFFTKFRFTTKGPNSLGGKNSNNIGIAYRGIHPSFLGNIDLLVCGNSDPGTSGILTPFGKIKGLYFDNSDEPDEFMYNFKEDIKNLLKEDGVDYIDIKADNKTDYYRLLEELEDFTKDNIKISGTSRHEYEIEITTDEKNESDTDENSEDVNESDESEE